MSNSQFSLAHLSRPPLKKEGKKAPAILLLHGVGANEQDLMGLASYLDPRFHVLSARAPITMGPNMYGWYWIQPLPSGGFHYSKEEALQSVLLIERFIDEAVAEYDLDPDKLFLVGFSQGAIQSCALLLLHPEKMAGIVAMSGRWPDPAEAQQASDARLANKPVLAVHGIYDPVIPVSHARELKEKFESLPVDFAYQEFPIAHSTSWESIQVVSRWLTKHLDN